MPRAELYSTFRGSLVHVRTWWRLRKCSLLRILWVLRFSRKIFKDVILMMWCNTIQVVLMMPIRLTNPSFQKWRHYRLCISNRTEILLCVNMLFIGCWTNLESPGTNSFVRFKSNSHCSHRMRDGNLGLTSQLVRNTLCLFQSARLSISRLISWTLSIHCTTPTE